MRNGAKLSSRAAERGLRLACLVSAVVLLSASCQSQQTSINNGGPSATRAGAAQGAVSSFTWDLPFGEPGSLDFIKAFNYSENTVLSNMCEGLLRLTPDFTFAPALAQSVTHPTPTTWVYDIRQGVKFWDGNPMTPHDVVYSLNRHLDPKLGSFYSLPFAAEIASVKQTGPWLVTVTTTTPTNLINEMMVTGLGTVAEAKYMQQKGSSYGTPSGGIMCTGPFKFEQWISGTEISMVRNPNYWDPQHQAHAGRVVFKFITDSTTLTAALLSGEIDGTYEAPVAAVGQLQASTTGSLFLGQSTQLFVLYPTGTGALANPQIRQAVSMSIDREAIARSVFQGVAQPLKSAFLLPTKYSYASSTYATGYANLPTPTIDLKQASALVKQAGSPSTPIRVAIPADDTATLQVANQLVDTGQKIGLHFVIRQMPASDFISLFFDPNARKSVDAMITSGYSDVPDPLEYFEISGLPNSIQNFSNYSSPTVTSSIRLARASDDPEARARLVLRAVSAIDKDLPIIPILYLPERLYLSKRLAGAPSIFPYQYYPWAADVGAASGTSST